MMRLGVLTATLAALPFLSRAVEYEIASCDDLSSVDDRTVTALTITSDTIACGTYTRFPVRNTLTIKATVPDVTFSNFSLKVLGNLTVEPDVTFQDVVDAVSQHRFHNVASLRILHRCKGVFDSCVLLIPLDE